MLNYEFWMLNKKTPSFSIHHSTFFIFSYLMMSKGLQAISLQLSAYRGKSEPADRVSAKALCIVKSENRVGAEKISMVTP
jgi:hypothetical protein